MGLLFTFFSLLTQVVAVVAFFSVVLHDGVGILLLFKYKYYAHISSAGVLC
jgi:hypothetical protein